MSKYHVVYIPIEWSSLSIKTLRIILELEILAHFHRKNVIEGSVICLESVITVLERFQNHIWLKRYNDTRSCPFHNDYIYILISCIVPGP